MELNQNARKWVAALRSGQFKQGFQRLTDHRGGFCCLGVACYIYEQETGHQLPKNKNGRYLDSDRRFQKSLNENFSVVKNWLGLKTPEGVHAMFHSLTDDNDDRKSFEEIADVIESKANILFEA